MPSLPLTVHTCTAGKMCSLAAALFCMADATGGRFSALPVSFASFSARPGAAPARVGASPSTPDKPGLHLLCPPVRVATFPLSVTVDHAPGGELLRHDPAADEIVCSNPTPGAHAVTSFFTCTIMSQKAPVVKSWEGRNRSLAGRTGVVSAKSSKPPSNADRPPASGRPTIARAPQRLRRQQEPIFARTANCPRTSRTGQRRSQRVE